MTDLARRKLLPFSAAWPLVGGVTLGLVLRLAFNDGPEALGGRSLSGLYAMAGSFVYLAPFAVGALTGWLTERLQRRSLLRHFAAGAAANALVVLATLVIQIEGLICAILVVPLFSLVGGFGAIAMALICRASRHPGPPMAAFAVLPLLMAGVEAPLALPDDFGLVTAERLVAAPPERIWSQLMDTSAIRPEEVADGWMYRIGVPLPLFGVVERQGPLLVRHVEMGKGIRFDQIASDWEEGREVRWTYRFAANSFPSGALDDHVRIGGRHFDVLDTVYTMEPRGAQTLLRVSMRYRVSTRFNWYAEPLARGLIGNFEEVVLRLYARRAEGDAG